MWRLVVWIYSEGGRLKSQNHGLSGPQNGVDHYHAQKMFFHGHRYFNGTLPTNEFHEPLFVFVLRSCCADSSSAQISTIITCWSFYKGGNDSLRKSPQFSATLPQTSCRQTTNIIISVRIIVEPSIIIIRIVCV